LNLKLCGKGYKIFMPTWTNKACTITYDESMPYIMAQWLGYTTSFQYREVHEKLLSLMKETKTFKLLADNSNLPEISPEDQKWFNNNWLPRAIKEGYTALVILTGKSKFAQVTFNNLYQNVLTVKYFDNLDQAKQWLADFEKK
jgi:hypothetical protein